MNYCKNCGQPVQDLYCSHCGQKIVVERITFSFLWSEIFHFFTHIEHGFLYTSFRMLVAPGKTVTSFIDGKRKKYQSPVSYYLIWVTIFILFLYWMEVTFGENTVINYADYWGPSGATKLAISHLSFILTIIIPFQALYLYLLVTRHQYNYFESLVAAIYLVGSVIMLQFAFALGALVIHALSGLSINLKYSDLMKLGYFIWFIIDFIKLFSIRNKWIRGLTFVLLAGATFTLWRLYGVPQLVRFFFHH